MRNSRDRQRESTAYHEAGHAIAAFHEGIRFRYVTIVPEDDSLGHVHRWAAPGFRPDVSTSPHTLDSIDRRVLVALSGVTAEAKYRGGRMNHVGASSDYRQATELAWRRCSAGVDAYMRWRLDTSRAKWENPTTWATVVALASALLNRGTLTSAEARTVEQAAFQTCVNEAGRARHGGR